MKILITGAAGFIGAHLSARLVQEGHECVFMDRISTYYSSDLKNARFAHLVAGDLNRIEIQDPQFRLLFQNNNFDCVIHLAAQPGVRVGFPENLNYYKDNIEAFSIVSRYAIATGVKRVIYASSSSVYEKAKSVPFNEDEVLEMPTHAYPFSKWVNEQTAESLSKLSSTEFIGLRFFSVYGPWGRPDMAYFRLIAAASGDYEFTLNGNGLVKRDFTFIDDVIDRIYLVMTANEELPAILNIGGGNPVSILDLMDLIGAEMGREIDFQSGESNIADIPITRSNSSRIDAITGDKPFKLVQEGIRLTADWYKGVTSEYNIKNWLK